jgi:hypothetical protein
MGWNSKTIKLYYTSVLEVNKNKFKYLKTGDYVVCMHGLILIYSNEKEFNHAFNIIGDIENPDGGRVDNETSL